ncbi:MAG: glycosyltransferase [Oscillatoria sp. SIO1A7]|nr:glycosyltransferase [Oscillatoria sp. SIO1A7]
MPLISIIMPAYNGEKTIRETVESVISQSQPDWELIAIDDGSQDSTVEILSSIGDPRVKVFSYFNSGPSTSRNRGIARARGDYISFIDADDLWTPDKLESQLQALQKHPQAALAYSWINFIDESSQFARRGSYVALNGNVYANLLIVNFLESGSNPLIRREALTEVGGFDESLTHGEDWDLWLRLAASYDFVAVPSPQVLYRVGSISATSNVSKQEAGMLRVIDRAFEQAPETLQYLKPYSLGNTYKYLTFKALEGCPEGEKGLIGGRFIWQAIRSDRTLLRKRVIWKAWLKIALVLLLPPQIARPLLFKMGSLSNLEALLAHIIAEPETRFL